MPLTPSPAAGPRRRSMLAGTLSTLGPLGALAGVAGCSGEKGSEDAAQVTRAELRMRRDAARQSRELLARYEATAAAHTGSGGPAAPDARGHGPARPRCWRQGRQGHQDGGGEREQDPVRRAAGRSPPFPLRRRRRWPRWATPERRTAQERTDALVKAPPGPGPAAGLARRGGCRARVSAGSGRTGTDRTGTHEEAGRRPSGGPRRRARHRLRVRRRRRPDREVPAGRGAAGPRRAPGPPGRAAPRGAGHWARTRSRPPRPTLCRSPSPTAPRPCGSPRSWRTGWPVRTRISCRRAEGARRREAAGSLREAAVRSVRWKGSGVAFPGLTEHTASEGPAPSGSPARGGTTSG